jgi:hypothetical protein
MQCAPLTAPIMSLQPSRILACTFFKPAPYGSHLFARHARQPCPRPDPLRRGWHAFSQCKRHGRPPYPSPQFCVLYPLPLALVAVTCLHASCYHTLLGRRNRRRMDNSHFLYKMISLIVLIIRFFRSALYLNRERQKRKRFSNVHELHANYLLRGAHR